MGGGSGRERKLLEYFPHNLPGRRCYSALTQLMLVFASSSPLYLFLLAMLEIVRVGGGLLYGATK